MFRKQKLSASRAVLAPSSAAISMRSLLVEASPSYLIRRFAAGVESSIPGRGFCVSADQCPSLEVKRKLLDETQLKTKHRLAAVMELSLVQIRVPLFFGG